MRWTGFASSLLLALLSTTAAAAEKELPWAFKAPRADGYSIDLVSAEPVPGTPLVAGSTVKFKVTVPYSMSVAMKGTIILVFQDDVNGNAKPDAPQVEKGVSSATGTVTLMDTLVVPTGAKELYLFIPLMPEGLTKTTGEITLRYPITKRK